MTMAMSVSLSITCCETMHMWLYLMPLATVPICQRVSDVS